MQSIRSIIRPLYLPYTTLFRSVRNVEYQVKAYQTGGDIAVRTIVRHPRFDYASYAASRATADVALVKLAAPLPEAVIPASRSEEHTSELQSPVHLVCRLLL